MVVGILEGKPFNKRASPDFFKASIPATRSASQRGWVSL